MGRLKIVWKLHFWGPFLHRTPREGRNALPNMSSSTKIDHFAKVEERNLLVCKLILALPKQNNCSVLCRPVFSFHCEKHSVSQQNFGKSVCWWFCQTHNWRPLFLTTRLTLSLIWVRLDQWPAVFLKFFLQRFLRFSANFYKTRKSECAKPKLFRCVSLFRTGPWKICDKDSYCCRFVF
jgi:hypothetical protein